jgi:hypothetical protein
MVLLLDRVLAMSTSGDGSPADRALLSYQLDAIMRGKDEDLATLEEEHAESLHTLRVREAITTKALIALIRTKPPHRNPRDYRGALAHQKGREGEANYTLLALQSRQRYLAIRGDAVKLDEFIQAII